MAEYYFRFSKLNLNQCKIFIKYIQKFNRKYFKFFDISEISDFDTLYNLDKFISAHENENLIIDFRIHIEKIMLSKTKIPQINIDYLHFGYFSRYQLDQEVPYKDKLEIIEAFKKSNKENILELVPILEQRIKNIIKVEKGKKIRNKRNSRKGSSGSNFQAISRYHSSLSKSK